MTKQHFQALAQALFEAKPHDDEDRNQMQVWEEVRRQTILACRLFNRQFDERKFMDATNGQ